MLLTNAACVVFLLLSAGCAGSHAREASGSNLPTSAEPTAHSWSTAGDEHMKRGDASRAAQYYEAALRGGDEKALPKLLAACVGSQQYALAIEHAEAALARDPANNPLRLLLGSLYGDTGEFARARQHLELAASEAPTDPGVQFTVAIFFRDEARDPARAHAYFQSYLTLSPAGAGAREAAASLMKTVE